MPSPPDGKISERIVARLRITEGGALSNPKVEQYALLRAEEVISPGAAWTIIMSSARGNLPSGGYQQNVHKSPAFKARLEGLMAEKTECDSRGVWGTIEWQAKQLYRKCSAMNDVKGMQSATDTLLRVAVETKKAAREAQAGEEDDEVKRGRGAPSVPAPLEEDSKTDYFAERLVGMK